MDLKPLPSQLVGSLPSDPCTKSAAVSPSNNPTVPTLRFSWTAPISEDSQLQDVYRRYHPGHGNSFPFHFFKAFKTVHPRCPTSLLTMSDWLPKWASWLTRLWIICHVYKDNLELGPNSPCPIKKDKPSSLRDSFHLRSHSRGETPKVETFLYTYDAENRARKVEGCNHSITTLQSNIHPLERLPVRACRSNVYNSMRFRRECQLFQSWSFHVKIEKMFRGLV